jgi:anti-sigma factor ChrR (cupin superfamily)
VHGGGGEFLLLDGTFSGERGEHPAGTWWRSPRWSRHTPFTGSEGALIGVTAGHLGATFMAPPATD